MSNHASRRGRRRPKPSPAGVALLDQAAAAGRQTHGMFLALTDHFADDGPVVTHDPPGPITRQIYNRMHLRMLARVAAGQPSLCPHLSHQAPAPAWWSAWAPGLVRCTPCAKVEQQRITGTPDDHRCDHCGTVGPTIHPCVLELPAVVVDHLPRGEASSLPPMLMSYGLCPVCLEVDRAAA